MCVCTGEVNVRANRQANCQSKVHFLESRLAGALMQHTHTHMYTMCRALTRKLGLPLFCLAPCGFCSGFSNLTTNQPTKRLPNPFRIAFTLADSAAFLLPHGQKKSHFPLLFFFFFFWSLLFGSITRRCPHRQQCQCKENRGHCSGLYKKKKVKKPIFLPFHTF